MHSKRKILAVTGARSEYDLMFSVFQKLSNDPAVDFQIVITGPHLSENFGYTARNIEADGFKIADKIFNLVDSNQKIGRVVSIGFQIPSLAHTFQRIKPDLILVAGDREEAISTTLTAAYLDMPVAHFFGGDIAKDGNIDNSVRYAASKFAHVHFTTLDSHRENLIKLGEDPWRIHTVGNPGLDRFLSTPDLSKHEVGERIGVPINPDENFFVLIQHSIITEVDKQNEHIRITLEEIRKTKTRCFLNYPNSDAGNFEIIQAYREYEQRFPEIFRTFKNLDRNTYVNLLRHASLLLGNSSSGLLEAPSLGLAAINIGSRQRGRVHGPNVIFVRNDGAEIEAAINYALTNSDFRTQLGKRVNPYGDGNSAAKISSLLTTIPLNKELIYKNITY